MSSSVVRSNPSSNPKSDGQKAWDEARQFIIQMSRVEDDAWSRFDMNNLRLTGRDLQEAIENWARAEARTLYHSFNGRYPFVRIYSHLARWANGNVAESNKFVAKNDVAPSAWIASVKEVKRGIPNIGWTDAMKEAARKPEFWQNKLEAFAPVAWTRFDPSSTDIANWARTEATTFHRLTDKNYPWVQAWQWLQTYGETRQRTAEAARWAERTRVAQQAAQEFRAASLARDASLASVFARDGEQTEAEARAGRAELNKILYREHTRWWDAFEAEASEDMDEDSPSASTRFAWHCAKILQNRTGLRQDLLVPVVEAWVLQNPNA
jgi:hypothetical protein